MKLQKEFNSYLADLAVITFKLHNLHWNVVGTQFVAVHEFTESIYDTTFEYFDEVAEHQKFFGVMPDCTFADYLKNATIKEIPAKKFTAEEVLSIVHEDLTTLRNKATELRNAADQEGWFSAVALFEGHVDYYNKQLWFVAATLDK